MKFFAGLYSYEIVLLVLGVLLFLVALVKLMKKPSAGLVVFFVLAITMIGYPSVQSIQYEKGVVTLQKKVHDLEANPGDESLRVSVQQDLGKVEARPGNDSTKVTVATAHFALGNEEAAKSQLQAVKNPELADARELNRKIELSDKLKALTAKVEATPGDMGARAQLDQAVSQVAQTPVANPKLLLNVRRAKALLKVEPATQIPPSTNPKFQIQKPVQMQAVRPAQPN